MATIKLVMVMWIWLPELSFLMRFTLIEFKDFTLTLLKVQIKSYSSFSFLSFSFTEHVSFLVSPPPSNSKEHCWEFTNLGHDMEGNCEINILRRNTSSKLAWRSCSFLSKSILKLQREVCEVLSKLLNSLIWNLIRQVWFPRHFLLTFSSEKFWRASVVLNLKLKFMNFFI